MNFVNLKKKSSSTPEAQMPNTRCAAYGCPCAIDALGVSQHKNVCRYHDGIDAKYWDAVTQKVRKYHKLIVLATCLMYQKEKYKFNSARIERINEALDMFGLFELHVREDLLGYNRECREVRRTESAYEFGTRLQQWIFSEVRRDVLHTQESEAELNAPLDDPFTRLFDELQLIKQRQENGRFV